MDGNNTKRSRTMIFTWQPWQTLIGLLKDSARLMVGVPNYDTYVAHQRHTAPSEPVMSYAEFMDNRQQARYSGQRRQMGRCC